MPYHISVAVTMKQHRVKTKQKHSPKPHFYSQTYFMRHLLHCQYADKTLFGELRVSPFSLRNVIANVQFNALSTRYVYDTPVQAWGSSMRDRAVSET